MRNLQQTKNALPLTRWSLLIGRWITYTPYLRDRHGSAGHPLIQTDEGVYSRSDNRLFDVGTRSIGAELLPEIAPHRYDQVAIAIEERASLFRGNAEPASQMTHDDRPAQRRGFKDVKTAERPRQRVEHRRPPAARQQQRVRNAQ